MKAYPSYEFRNYLYRIGLINYSDFPKIYEDAGNPKTQIISLSHILENAQALDLFEIADRIYKGWLNSLKGKATKKLIFIKSLITTRQQARGFLQWYFNKPQKEPPRALASNPTLHKPAAHLKPSLQKFASNPDLKLHLPNSTKSSIPYFRFTSVNEKTDNSLYSRLHEEAANKKHSLEKAANEVKNKELEECTFRPEISEKRERQGSVYERLNLSDIKEKEEMYKKQKVKKELEGCTFQPKTNSHKSMSVDRSFDKLYKDAEMQRQKIRTKEMVEKDKELVDCTFRPSILSPTQNPSGSVYDKLYKSYKDSQQGKRKLEIEKQSKELEEATFMPKLLTPKKEGDPATVYTRLYAEVEKRKEKMKKITEEQNKLNPVIKVRNSEDPPRYEHLYALHKENLEKKNLLQEKNFKEIGASFKPDVSKSNTPKRSRAATPSVPGQQRSNSVHSLSVPTNKF